MKVAEFGGPSALFKDYYDLYKDIDGYNIFENNYWQKEFKTNYKGNGLQFNHDVLIPIERSYDLILNSHVIEHIANPIKAILNWRNSLNDNGIIISIIPDKSQTFDCKRPLTTFQHIYDDYINETGEDDKTHIQEAVSLFVNNGEYDFENYIKSSLNNEIYRAIHHHCFDYKLVKDLFESLSFKITQQYQIGMHIYIIVQK